MDDILGGIQIEFLWNSDICFKEFWWNLLRNMDGVVGKIPMGCQAKFGWNSLCHSDKIYGGIQMVFLEDSDRIFHGIQTEFLEKFV